MPSFLFPSLRRVLPQERYFSATLRVCRSAFERVEPSDHPSYIRLKAIFELPAGGERRLDHPASMAEVYEVMQAMIMIGDEPFIREIVVYLQVELNKVSTTSALVQELALPSKANRSAPASTPGTSGSADSPQHAFLQDPDRQRAMVYLNRLYTVLANIQDRETLRDHALMEVAQAFVGFAALLLTGFVLFSRLIPLVQPSLWPFLFFGTLGSFASILQRLQRPVLDNYSLAYLVRLGDGNLSLWSSLLSGAIFAVVAISLISTGLIGKIIPTFAGLGSPESCPAVPYIWINLPTDMNCHPKFMEVALGCFLSGWSERFMPDVLSRIQAGTSKPQ